MATALFWNISISDKLNIFFFLHSSIWYYICKSNSFSIFVDYGRELEV